MSLGGWMSGEIFDITSSYYFAFMNGIIWNLFNLIIVIYIFINQISGIIKGNFNWIKVSKK